MDAPEVRLSPSGQEVAIRNNPSNHAPWRVTNGGHYRDAQVSNWTPLLPVSNEDGDEPFDIALPGGRYYGRWIKVTDHDAFLECGCGYASDPEVLLPVLDRAADELHRGH